MAITRFTRWTHFTIAEALPGSAWGTGGIGLADFDGDGDLDVAVSRRETETAYWFRRVDDATWTRHTIGTSPELARTLGAAVLDIDGDGLLDIAFSRVWFRNPGTLAEAPDTPWEAHAWEGGGHDVVAADINGDGRLDLVSYDGETLAWYETARGLAPTVISDGRHDHGGIAPRGVGDLTGNGLPDIVIPGFWFENPGTRGGDWTLHAWPHRAMPNASYGTSMRAWIADLNGNGWNDIVYADCDTGYGHVYWVENRGAGLQWVLHPLPDPVEAANAGPDADPRTGSWHSLAVADFDGDGRLEIFAGEQEDPDTYMTAQGLLPMKPPDLRERGVFWIPEGPSLTFTPVILHTGRPGWHDVAVGDVNGNGRPDLVSKVWNADGPGYHVDFWRNEIGTEDKG